MVNTCLILCLFVVSLGGHPTVNPWKEFVSAQGKFSALLPYSPDEPRTVAYTREGRPYTQTISVTDDDHNQYSVSWTDLRMDKEHQPETTFDKIRDALLAQEKTNLVSERTISIDGFPGREIVYESPRDQVTTMRFYVINDRFYQVTAQTKKDTKDQSGIDSFLDSFKPLPGTVL